LTETEFSRLCEFLYRRTGMSFGETKRYYVDRRVTDRMTATGETSFREYFQRLRGDVNGEIEHFVNAFTVNETYFYREDYQLACLTGDLLARRVAGKRKGQPVRIWSIPSSTGEEPYSVAIWMLENWPLVDAYDIEIIGSDIDTRVLEAAREGIYGSRALMRLNPALIEKYFEPLSGDRWRIIEDLRQSVRFTATNVMEAAETRSQGSFDVIFCRNMLIYFDDASRRLASENLYESLLPGGYVCLGHSESMSRISPLFEMCRFDQAIVYRRPMEGGDD
jgi:chemotaxis protein methyltransferase CheR